jgi:hypothetical protein
MALNVPVAVGVPLIWTLAPVTALSCSPVGRAVDVQCIAPVPPLAVKAGDV